VKSQQDRHFHWSAATFLRRNPAGKDQTESLTENVA
jgi:hypothetical protein